LPATSTTTSPGGWPGTLDEPWDGWAVPVDGWLLGWAEPGVGCEGPLVEAPAWATGEPVAVDGRVSGRVSGRVRKTDQAAQDRPMASTAARTMTCRGDKVQRASRSRSGRTDSGIHPPRTSSSRSSRCSSGACSGGRAPRRASARSRAPGSGAGARRKTFTPEKVRV
jgi:hypothetical protein